MFSFYSISKFLWKNITKREFIPSFHVNWRNTSEQQQTGYIHYQPDSDDDFDDEDPDDDLNI